MIGIIFQASNQINYGMVLIDSIIAAILLILLISFINVSLQEENRIPKALNKRSSLISTFIILGIIVIFRFLFEIFGYYIFLLRYFNNDYLHFAVMISLFYPINQILLKKFNKNRLLGEKSLIPKGFRIRLKIVILFAWIIASIFLSFNFLGVQLVWERYPFPPRYDIFYIGLIWNFFIILFNISITYLINKIRPIDKRLPKSGFNNAMIVSGIIAFGIYSIQFLVFEIYFNRVFGINLIVQDIRVQIVIVSTIYVIIFFSLLKAKFLPEVTIRSHKKIQTALKEERKVASQNRAFRDTKSITDLQELDKQLYASASYSLESVSLKLYHLLSKKFGKSFSFEEKFQLHKDPRNKSKILIVGLLWVIILVMVLLRPFLFTLNLDGILEILFVGAQSAFFMVLIDISLIIIANRIIPAEKRIPKGIFRNSILFGGIFSFWIWSILLFVVFLYLFIFISDVVISDLVFITISSIIYTLIGIFCTRWRARKKNWGNSNSLKKASLIYLIWLILDIPLKIIVYNLIQPILISEGIFISLIIFNLFYDLLLSILYILIILPIVLKVYKTKFKESLKFAFIVQIILFFAIIILGYILGIVDNIISTLHFNIGDIRVPLIVISGVYLLSFLFSLKVVFLDEVPKLIEKKRTKEVLPQESVLEEKEVILDVHNLTTYFYTEEGIVKAVEGVSFKIHEGEVLGLVGETGCGKSVTALSILQLVRPPGKIESGEIIFKGEDLLKKTENEILSYRGNKITMIFQDPLNSLNPVFKIGSQITEVFLLHMENELLIEAIKHSDKSIYTVAREWSEQLLRDLNIPFPEVVFDRYPHELSGGMRQRVQIAMGLACSPKLLIADEPTTALDVTVQNQILKLMKDLRKEYNTSILFITHDLGIISKMCNRVAVMYSGFIVEYGRIEKLFTKPYHPYTKGLISSVPVVGKKRQQLEIIRGTVPNLIYPPSGCRFHPRCQYCFEPCNSIIPKSIEVEPLYFVACHLYDPEYENLTEIAIKKVEEENLTK